MNTIPFKTSYRVENIVATVILEHDLDLELIETRIPSITYKPDQFPGLIFRLDKPRATALVFKSGKMVVTGTKSTQQLVEAVKKIIKTFVKNGVNVHGRPRVQIQNIVAGGDIHAYVNLEKAAYHLEDSMYEPEQFPGLIHRMRDPRVVLLIFSSGKMVITGAKEEVEVERAVNNIARQLYKAGCIVGPRLGEEE
ncbi:TATA-box-binding protein [Desulfurococcus amylolyticus]|uniref:TATA-box-binding protein n=1 Tax=Desulfurococcus amylolyticus (strain DSM 18924 / JCM 16383 / VKM B-2413 / 1221n) TaxID=490899 RepID=B8D2L3_DESA1|nr:TATA-box-binding protein [Desulfurococcus amylolyticus]ACL10601.1 transcription factor - TATA-box-binding protein [Desulfurococcus amylolyticus 1221n]